MEQILFILKNECPAGLNALLDACRSENIPVRVLSSCDPNLSVTDCGITLPVTAAGLTLPLDTADTAAGLLVITDDSGIGDACCTHGIAVLFLESPDAPEVRCPGAVCALQSLEGITPDFLLKMYRRAHDIPWTIAETERLILREMTLSDLPALRQIYRDPSVKLQLCDEGASPEEEEEFTRAYIRSMYRLWGFGFWTVIEKASGDIIGRVGFGIRDGLTDPELGYVIGQKYRRKGYAREACIAALAYSRKELLFPRILCLTQEDNHPSRSLCASLGFTPVMEGDAQRTFTDASGTCLLYEQLFPDIS